MRFSIFGFLFLFSISAFSAPVVQGTWRTICLSAGDLYMKSEIHIDSESGLWTHYGSFFKDAECAAKPFANMSFVDHIKVTENGMPEIYNVDKTSYQALLSATHPDTVKVYNEKGICGFTDWVLGVYRDVTGIKVGGCGYRVKGSILYTIFAIKGDKFQYGLSDVDHDGTTPDKRHIKLIDYVWVRE